jgi:hypothetical protein
MVHLKKVLFDEYDGFADKRIKKLESGTKYIVDDRGLGDFGADKKLFGHFCLIFADLSDEPTVRVTMTGGVPTSAAVSAWFKKHASPYANGYAFSIAPGEEGKLIELATAIGNIVKPGARYSVKAYKHMCPRTAASLKRLARVLAGAGGT